MSVKKSAFLLLSAVLLSFYFSGCVTSGTMRCYFYEGTPRPREDVALIVMQRYLYPVGLVNLHSQEDLWTFSTENPSPMKMPYTFDLTPGGYKLRVVYFHNSVAVGDPIDFDLHADAGKIYYLCHKSLQNGTWQLKMEEFTKAEDFAAFNSSFHEDRESGEAILERAERHFTATEAHSVYAD